MSAGIPFQSKLLPHADEIRRLRASRRTYVQIASLLREMHGMVVAPSTVFSFVKARSRRRIVVEMTTDNAVTKVAIAATEPRTILPDVAPSQDPRWAALKSGKPLEPSPR